MKLSTKGRYGTRALLELALHYREGPIPLKDIARSQQISLHYLEHIVTPLVLRKEFGGKTLAVYLLVISTMALVLGWGFSLT